MTDEQPAADERVLRSRPYRLRLITEDRGDQATRSLTSRLKSLTYEVERSSVQLDQAGPATVRWPDRISIEVHAGMEPPERVALTATEISEYWPS